MSIEIKGLSLVPRRQTYSHIARRFGEDRPATRYEEATFDLQAVANFHYRPIYAPDREIHDPSLTAIKMADWYVFRDPRQFYYGTYSMSRASMNETIERHFKMVDERGLLDQIDADWMQKVHDYLIPMRHYEWGANMNNMLICDIGYGTQITSAAAFCAMDRLGMALYISRLGLAIDGNSGEALEQGRTDWVEAPYWQATRHAVEDSFVIQDWFETFIAQNLALDGVMHPLVFGEFDAASQSHNAMGITLITQFMTDWFKDNSRWVDAVVKAAAAESTDNKQLLAGWFKTWRGRAAEAAVPVAGHVLGDQGGEALKSVLDQLDARAGQLGLAG